jgi:hypothetical protein
MPRQRFARPGTTTLDASGAGQVELQPNGADWLIQTTSVSTSTATLIPEARTYLNGVNDGALIEGTYDGSRDTSDTEIPMQGGDRLIVRWEGGDAGARATVVVRGWQYPPGELESG